MQNHDEGISLEACEFWSTFCDSVAEPEMLRPFLPRLVPILLCNMVYEDFDEEVADAEAAEVVSSTADRDADIKPFIHRCTPRHTPILCSQGDKALMTHHVRPEKTGRAQVHTRCAIIGRYGWSLLIENLSP